MNRSLNNSTSRDAVLAAIQVFDSKGQKSFLETYGVARKVIMSHLAHISIAFDNGYKQSRIYVLGHAGHDYDSKESSGAAYGKQHGTPIKASDCSGGEKAVVRCFERLGFSMHKTANSALSLTRGSTYLRKHLVANAVDNSKPAYGL